jgi:hypothetical protein
MTEETREPSLSGRGRSRYSSLGSATAAQAAAAASRMSDPDLVRARLFGHSACQTPPSRPTAHRRGRNRADRSPCPALGSRTPTRLARPPTTPRTSQNSPPRSSTGPHPACPPPSPPPRPTSPTPSRRLLECLHLAELSGHHGPRRADRRCRLLPRLDAPAVGRHHPLRCRQQRQRPRDRARWLNLSCTVRPSCLGGQTPPVPKRFPRWRRTRAAR